MRDRITAKGGIFGWALLAVTVASAGGSAAQDLEAAAQLARELGCAGCHRGLPGAGPELFPAPDLSFAGLQFNPAHLFDYLLHPHSLRRKIGGARMPDFRLDPEESLSLTLFLGRQRTVRDGWPAAPAGDAAQVHQTQSAGTVTIEGLGCLECHRFEGEGVDEAVDLDSVGVRLERQWVETFHIDPSFFLPGTAMPGYFYSRNESTNDYQAVIHDAALANGSVVGRLFDAARERRQALQEAFRDAGARFPEASAAAGEHLFRANNCAVCHRLGLDLEAAPTAPDLTFEGSRVLRSWLEGYLRSPAPVRPAGDPPGSGARMPDFRLSDQEVNLLSALLISNTREASGPEAPMVPLSLFAMRKAARLLAEKLPCLGCHQLGDQGGRIGPNLSSLKNRLQPSFVRDLIRDPQAWMPDTIMPAPRLRTADEDLIVGFLVQQEIEAAQPQILPLRQAPPVAELEDGVVATGQQLYHRYCSHCHGPEGDGDGFNAPFLPFPPTSHSDAAVMSRRPDDTLFDGIHSGAAILGKSPRMPAFGGTLSGDEITALIAHIRRMCSCQGPTWSRDGVR